METGILYTVRNTIIQAFLAFPYIMIWFIAFLAIGLGNLGLFVLFIGHTLILPLAIVITHGIIDWKLPPTPDKHPFHLRADINGKSKALVVPSFIASEPYINVAPSYWMAHTLFLFGYIVGNAISILNMPNDPNIDSILLQNRSVRASMVLAVGLLFAVVLSGLRYKTHSETVAGMGVALIIGGVGGFAWYKFAETCGIRSADVFGIAQQVVIPSSANDNRPMTCVYNPKP